MKVATSETTIPVELRETDVLFGRGGDITRRYGNKVFREIVRRYHQDYIKSPRGLKRDITAKVVHAIAAQDPPGRFLELNPEAKGSRFRVASKAVALMKTSQAMRDCRKAKLVVRGGDGPARAMRDCKKAKLAVRDGDGPARTPVVVEAVKNERSEIIEAVKKNQFNEEQTILTVMMKAIGDPIGDKSASSASTSSQMLNVHKDSGSDTIMNCDQEQLDTIMMGKRDEQLQRNESITCGSNGSMSTSESARGDEEEEEEKTLFYPLYDPPTLRSTWSLMLFPSINAGTHNINTNADANLEPKPHTLS